VVAVAVLRLVALQPRQRLQILAAHAERPMLALLPWAQQVAEHAARAERMAAAAAWALLLLAAAASHVVLAPLILKSEGARFLRRNGVQVKLPRKRLLLATS